MSKPKILLVSKLYHPWIGGVEQHVKLLAEELAGEFDINVLCCQEPGGKPVNGDSDYFSNRKIVAVPIYKAPSLGIYWSMPVSPAFPSWLKRLAADADLIHLHLPFPLAELAYRLVRPQAKLVITWHSDIVRQKWMGRILAPLSHWVLEKASAIITTSERLQENSRALGSFRRQTQIIPLGINTKAFAPTPSIEKQAGEIRRRHGTPLILFIGRLVPYKGVSCLLEALVQAEPQAKLLIIGEGPLKNKLQNQAAQLGLNGRAAFLGAVPEGEMAAYYHACDIFTLPSVASNEAFGIVQMEAMAAGKPVINTALPTGVTEVSRNNETGITVPPGNSQALAEAINKLLGDESWRRALGRQAQQRAQTDFNANSMAQRISKIYRHALRL